MERMSPELLKSLDFSAAVHNELAATRNLIPQEPWVSVLAGKEPAIARWVRASCQAGHRVASSFVLSARKAAGGTRPVPIVGIAERIIYRALVKFILRDEPALDRSPEAYRDFIAGPIEAYFFHNHPLDLDALDSIYVVEADVTSFYQYVDHDVLRRELELRTGEIDAIDHLIDLLLESEGRGFGIPQLLDPFDDLSEIYVQIVERDLVRQGHSVWRFNDDFRILCSGYGEALTAIEALAQSARMAGLNINDHKTFTPSMLTYLGKYTGLDVSADLAQINPADVEVSVAPYAEFWGDAGLVLATETLERMHADYEGDKPIKLKDIRGDQIADLRRAFAVLVRERSPLGFPYFHSLVAFVPALTPQLFSYLEAMYASRPEEVEAIVDELIGGERPLSRWQLVWMVHTLRVTQMLVDSEQRRAWVRRQWLNGRFHLLGAEAAIALAEIGEAEYSELDESTRTEPEPLVPWYVLAMKAVASHGRASPSQLSAVGQESPLYKVLLS